MFIPATFRSLMQCMRFHMPSRTHRYHPERHYMRGPGPAYAARMARMSGSQIG